MTYLEPRERTSDAPMPIDGFVFISMYGPKRVGFSSPEEAQIEINKNYPKLKGKVIFQDFNYWDGSSFGKVERRTAILTTKEAIK